MRYHSSVDLDEKTDKVWQILKPEEGKKDRSQIGIRKSGKTVQIIVKAEDYIAFKASINQILKALAIIEKVAELPEK